MGRRPVRNSDAAVADMEAQTIMIIAGCAPFFPPFFLDFIYVYLFAEQCVSGCRRHGTRGPASEVLSFVPHRPVCGCCSHSEGARFRSHPRHRDFLWISLDPPCKYFQDPHRGQSRSLHSGCARSNPSLDQCSASMLRCTLSSSFVLQMTFRLCPVLPSILQSIQPPEV
jgi:hypothetical protein